MSGENSYELPILSIHFPQGIISNFSKYVDLYNDSIDSLSTYGNEDILEANASNLTASETLIIPKELTFHEDALVSLIAYSIFFVISATGNLLVFITLFKNRHRKSRVNLFIMHLSIADLIVTFIMMPMEIGWHITVKWVAGDLACRILMFFRVFGFYLSSSILIAISLDRFFAITKPLRLNDARKRAKFMLISAWVFSACSSIPQSFIYHVDPHPLFPWFTQCVTFDFFPSPKYELVYNLFNMFALYIAPLVIILVSYTLILCEITKRSKQNHDSYAEPRNSRRKSSENSFSHKGSIRSSGISRIEKARIRTLKMTIVIVSVFVTCWTPYFAISACWWVDKNFASKIDPKIQRGMLLFAVSNSCVNPIIYGMFTNTFIREIKRCWPGNAQESTPNGPPMALKQNSHYSHKLACVRKPNQSKATTPLLAKKSPSSSTESGDKENNKKGRQTIQKPIAQEIICTACAVAITPQTDALYISNMKPRERPKTPPHIAQGRGNKASFEAFLLL